MGLQEALASPVMWHWAMCSLDFQQINFFQLTLELHTSLMASPNKFAFCDCSCGSSVAARPIWTLFSVY